MSKSDRNERKPDLVINNLPFVIKPEEVRDLHPSIVSDPEPRIHRGFAFVFLDKESDVEDVKSQIDGTPFHGRALRASVYEDRPPRDRGDRDSRESRDPREDRGRGRSPRRSGPPPRDRDRSRSSSQGRAQGPRRPRVIKVSSSVMVLKVPSVEQFLQGLSFSKNEEKSLIASEIGQPPVKGATGFDPAILVAPTKAKGEKAPKSHSTVVIHKRTSAVTDSEGKVWARTTAAKEEAEKTLAILQEAGLDCRDLVFMRFEGEAIFQSLAPLQLAIGRVFNEEEKPMGIGSIKQVTHNSTEVAVMELRKWKPEEVEEED